MCLAIPEKNASLALAIGSLFTPSHGKAPQVATFARGLAEISEIPADL